MRFPSLRVAGLLCASLLMMGFLIMPACVRAGEREPREERESGPALILPGNHVVHPGEWIELGWTRADAISEMEILLSRDGGRSYTVCISPSLDPRRCGFRWRVPETAGDLRMRIRFNRGGLEIEGAPSAPLRVSAGESDAPQPLGLPPLERAGAAREPRAPGERSGGQGTRAAAGVMDGRAGSDPTPDASGPAETPAPDPSAPRPAAGARPFAAPRSLPLRS